MSATDAICPSPGLLPSRFGKFRVVWRIESPPFAGTSPAPKHGPQNAERSVAPVSMRSRAIPVSSMRANTGWLAGYAESANSPHPIECPRRMSAAAERLSYVPPAHPAMTPCETRRRPVSRSTLSVRRSAPGRSPSFASPAFSVSRRMSAAFSLSSRTVKALDGWNGSAIIGSTVERSISTAPS